MEHIPTTESYVQKVIRKAKELDISIERASIMCDAFDWAFSDPQSRSAIFEMIEQLDEPAARKGEPAGLIINYGVEVGRDGIRVGRYADEVPPGETVQLTPPHQASIFLTINDDFPTHDVLGPMIMDRPCSHLDTFDPGTEIPEDVSDVLPSKVVICLGPIRHTFNERFPIVTAAVSRSQVRA